VDTQTIDLFGVIWRYSAKNGNFQKKFFSR